jgi:hypothetical protein
MVGTCKENGSRSNAKEDNGRKTVYRTKERKTSSKVDGRRSRLESKWIEKTKDREQWRLVIEEAKVHPGL